MISRRLIPRGALLAALVLIWAQTLLAVHGVEHVGDQDGEHVCNVCLTGHGTDAPLDPSVSPPAFPSVPTSVDAVPACTPAPRHEATAHHARTPPAPLRS